ncbi:MAG: competence/damage-inducible protein A [Deltaproteobacteria bacterium]|nr:competence/damage-inducible protein A [Deltaproteobacteria bacterium]
MATRVGVVILGDEVLKAEVSEANLGYILHRLNEWGAEVTLCAILPDDIETVARHLRAYLGEADLLVLTGGIGPTPDDITREAVARVAGVPLIVHPDAKEELERYYGDRINTYRMLMAQVPEGASLIPNPVSAAPGFFVSRMAAFPGVPMLLQRMFDWIRPHIEGKRKSRVILFGKVPESGYAGIMKDAMADFPDVSVGSYPMMEAGYSVRVVFRANEFARAAACADSFTEKLRGAGWELSRREEERGDEG